MDDIDSVSLVKVVARPADDDGDATVTERQWAVAAVARAAHASFAVALTSSAGTERWRRINHLDEVQVLGSVRHLRVGHTPHTPTHQGPSIYALLCS